MVYKDVLLGIFQSRPNRFIAHVEADGATQVCHVKNTGRLGELLLPGASVFLQPAQNPNRKTRYDLISVYKGDTLVNIDSSAPNRVFGEWVRQSGYFGTPTLVRPEATFGGSRLDFYVEVGPRKIYVEVKGATLVDGELALFPDAPTLRGVRHLNELIECRRQGYEAAAVFVVKLKGPRAFAPNGRTHPEFASTLAKAAASGVEILALDCHVTPDSLTADSLIPVILPEA